MKNRLLLLPVILIILLSGCRSRSISNSEYGSYNYYPGELSELEVLGVGVGKEIAEDDIQEAMRRHAKIAIDRGDTIVLIQSGARFPDDSMMSHVEKLYNVIPMSGVPSRPRSKNPWEVGEESRPREETTPLDMSLRLAAARGGARAIVVYWGVLESGRKGYATKTVSWVPIAGYFIPDENQLMRIRIKAAIIDVETGDWEMITPKTFEDQRISAVLNRERSDQAQVEKLKDMGYERLIAEIKMKYEL